MRKVYPASRKERMRQMAVGERVSFLLMPLADKQSIRNAASDLKKKENKHYKVNYDYETQTMIVTRLA